jgi:hypothetical protein
MTPTFGFEGNSSKGAQSHKAAKASSSSRHGGGGADDLDDLIDDMNGGEPTGSVGSFKYQAPITVNSHHETQQTGGKCYPLFIGG